jgi:hypothetical protein
MNTEQNWITISRYLAGTLPDMHTNVSPVVWSCRVRAGLGIFCLCDTYQCQHAINWSPVSPDAIPVRLDIWLVPLSASRASFLCECTETEDCVYSLLIYIYFHILRYSVYCCFCCRYLFIVLLFAVCTTAATKFNMSSIAGRWTDTNCCMVLSISV